MFRAMLTAGREGRPLSTLTIWRYQRRDQRQWWQRQRQRL